MTGMTISGISLRATASADIVEAAIIDQVVSWSECGISLREDINFYGVLVIGVSFVYARVG
jgi:hypothetical protein